MTKSFSVLCFKLPFRGKADVPCETAFPSGRFASPKTVLLAIGLAVAGLYFDGSPAHAQSPVLQQGDGVITGFSGVAVPNTAFPPGVNPLDKILIDPEGPSAQILRLAPQGPLQGQLLTPSVFKLKARDVGQVFGVALDDAPVKNIYLAATSAFGLQIVTPDTDGDGFRNAAGSDVRTQAGCRASLATAVARVASTRSMAGPARSACSRPFRTTAARVLVKLFSIRQAANFLSPTSTAA